MSITPKNTERAGKIIMAAAQLFARQGYHGTSTREIARLADISENTLFRHFEHKEDIFWAALRAGLSGLKLRKDLVEGIAECHTPEIVLPQILGMLVDTVTFKPELLCLIAVALIELRWKAEVICHEHFSPIFSALRRYMTMNIESGKVRNLDPGMITAAMAMTALVHPELSKLMSGEPPPHSDSREAIRAYTKFWLDILVPLSTNRATTAKEIVEPRATDRSVSN